MLQHQEIKLICKKFLHSKTTPTKHDNRKVVDKKRNYSRNTFWALYTVVVTCVLAEIYSWWNDSSMVECLLYVSLVLTFNQYRSVLDRCMQWRINKYTFLQLFTVNYSCFKSLICIS